MSDTFLSDSAGISLPALRPLSEEVAQRLLLCLFSATQRHSPKNVMQNHSCFTSLYSPLPVPPWSKGPRCLFWATTATSKLDSFSLKDSSVLLPLTPYTACHINHVTSYHIKMFKTPRWPLVITKFLVLPSSRAWPPATLLPHPVSPVTAALSLRPCAPVQARFFGASSPLFPSLLHVLLLTYHRIRDEILTSTSHHTPTLASVLHWFICF